MRIIHVIAGLNVGGAEMMLRRLVETQFSQGFSPLVISLTDVGVIGAQLELKGITVKAIGLQGFLKLPLSLYRLYRTIKDYSPDIVQTWMYHADLIGGIAARLAGIKNIVWGVRTTDVTKGGKKITFFVRVICAYLSRYIPSVIVCAAQASLQAHEEIGYDSSKMVVVPNGFDLNVLDATLDQRNSLRASVGIYGDELVIGSIGRFNAVKDHETFIGACSILLAKYPSLRVIMVGRGLDPSNQKLKALLSIGGHMDRYILLGERQDVPVCLKSMDIFCLHSKTEGFPNVLGEAMAMKLPCVTTDVGDAAFLLADDRFVVPAQDVSALALALDKIISLSDESRLFLGETSRFRVSNNFTLEKTADNFSDIYRCILNKKFLENS